MSTVCHGCDKPDTKPGEDFCWDCLGESLPTFMDELRESPLMPYQVITIKGNYSTIPTTFTWSPNTTITTTTAPLYSSTYFPITVTATSTATSASVGGWFTGTPISGTLKT